jgi:hypothetical protein
MELLPPPLFVPSVASTPRQTLGPEPVRCQCEGHHLAHENKLTQHDEELARLKSEMQRQALLIRQQKLGRESDKAEMQGWVRQSQNEREKGLEVKDGEIKQYVDARLDDEVRSLDEDMALVKTACETAIRESRRNNCVYTISGTFLGVSLIYSAYWLVFAPVFTDLNPVHWF